MSSIFLEHVNITVKDPEACAALLCRLFDWKIRWQGDSMDVGYTVHVGGEKSYIALYTQPNAQAAEVDSYAVPGQMNHIGIVVDDIDAIEQRVSDENLKITSHADYEPGRRFYFSTPGELEIEVVSYA